MFCHCVIWGLRHQLAGCSVSLCHAETTPLWSSFCTTNVRGWHFLVLFFFLSMNKFLPGEIRFLSQGCITGDFRATWPFRLGMCLEIVGGKGVLCIASSYTLFRSSLCSCFHGLLLWDWASGRQTFNKHLLRVGLTDTSFSWEFHPWLLVSSFWWRLSAFETPPSAQMLFKGYLRLEGAELWVLALYQLFAWSKTPALAPVRWSTTKLQYGTGCRKQEKQFGYV